MNTELSLDVATTHNRKIIRLFDTSNYCKDEKIDNYLVEILPVSKSAWVTYYVNKDFSLTLNSSNMGYKTVSDNSDLLNLQDGVYEIKQSYKPNSATVIHYYHLRVTDLELRYLQTLNSHFSEECKKDKRAYEEETENLSIIRSYIDAAVYAANDYHDKVLAIKYYNKAIELITKYDNECGCR